MLTEGVGWDLLQYVREKPELREFVPAVVTGFPREKPARDRGRRATQARKIDDRLVSTVLKLIERDSPAQPDRPAI
jgi:hypothetical protein